MPPPFLPTKITKENETMMCFLKKTAKVGVISAVLVGLAAVGSSALLGHGRTEAVIHELHGNIIEQIDSQIDDPTAMRSQLREMEKEYPERIAQVRGDLAELQAEIKQLERQEAVAERVVQLADRDIQGLEEQLAMAPSGDAQLVAVHYDNQVFSVGRARARLTQIKNSRIAYANRAADARHDLAYLLQQSTRLEELAVKLETERAEFQGQIEGLSRQIDAIARNDRLIKLLEKRNRTIEECSRYEAVSLDQITGRLDLIRSRQEAELDLLANKEQSTDYEDLAIMQLSEEALAESLLDQPVAAENFDF